MGSVALIECFLPIRPSESPHRSRQEDNLVTLETRAPVIKVPDEV